MPRKQQSIGDFINDAFDYGDESIMDSLAGNTFDDDDDYDYDDED